MKQCPLQLLSNTALLCSGFWSDPGAVGSYRCGVLLVHSHWSNQSLGEDAVVTRLSSQEPLIAPGLRIQPGSTDVAKIGELVLVLGGTASSCWFLLLVPFLCLFADRELSRGEPSSVPMARDPTHCDPVSALLP